MGMIMILLLITILLIAFIITLSQRDKLQLKLSDITEDLVEEKVRVDQLRKQRASLVRENYVLKAKYNELATICPNTQHIASIWENEK